ncbi:phosphatase PAP2 family protein [Salicibibacter kimchii]|uniref:Phosphatase PAP2 family protein n=1 Tax=Salicibibacter kimchii TaxID=2099786 RepID=A0A345BXS9_9BACI|nr:phosphatase PAP2 family protein [Salicibibacter kimchii]AXF55760.1 phosphatase PAP2 family protein [Salicibibacter kimchii]
MKRKIGLAIGTIASRPVLGVHFPTDVLAAAMYAFIWLVAVLRLSPEKIMEKKG